MNRVVSKNFTFIMFLCFPKIAKNVTFTFSRTFSAARRQRSTYKSKKLQQPVKMELEDEHLRMTSKRCN